MKKLIKKILKEEFEWIDEIQTNPAEEFLYEKFMECKLVKSKTVPGWIKYIDDDGKILFVDSIEKGDETTFLYFDYDEIYLKLKKMGLDLFDMRVLIKDMLYKTLKRNVSEVQLPFSWKPLSLYENNKRK